MLIKCTTNPCSKHSCLKAHQYALTEQSVKCTYILHGMMYCNILIEYSSVVGLLDHFDCNLRIKPADYASKILTIANSYMKELSII